MRIGVDIGGTKIEAIALANDGKIIDRRRKPTPTGDYRSILDVVVRSCAVSKLISVRPRRLVSPCRERFRQALASCVIPTRW